MQKIHNGVIYLEIFKHNKYDAKKHLLREAHCSQMSLKSRIYIEIISDSFIFFMIFVFDLVCSFSTYGNILHGFFLNHTFQGLIISSEN